jgi:thiol-disulfide isomerase/thioredoxin
MKFISIGPNDAALFDKLVKNKPAFVKFYSPFCIHCIEMAPAWNALKGLQNKVNIIAVHSGAIHKIRSACAQNINGFPTIMEVKPGGKPGREYLGSRDANSMLEFINTTFQSRKKTHKRKKTRKQKKNQADKRLKKHIKKTKKQRRTN